MDFIKIMDFIFWLIIVALACGASFFIFIVLVEIFTALDRIKDIHRHLGLDKPDQHGDVQHVNQDQ